MSKHLKSAVLAYALSSPDGPLRQPAVLGDERMQALEHALAADGGVPAEAKTEGHVHVYNSPQAALRAAQGLLRVLRLHATAPTLRLILDCGDVAVEGGQVSGTVLDRVNAWLTRAREPAVMASQMFLDALPRDMLAALDVTPIDGEALVLLQFPETLPEPDPTSQTGARLTLRHQSQTQTLAAADCPITIGRGASAHYALSGDFVSREHGHIAFAQGQFYYVDTSRNGTYVLTSRGDQLRIFQSRFPLVGRGVISPGAPVAEQTGDVLRYSAVPGGFDQLVEEAEQSQQLRQ